MAQCETCGNEYDKAFQVVLANTSYTFDSFECAIQALAPTCSHCGCRILGHGVESEEAMYCCAHCASQHGVGKVRDRV
jgi:phage terminase large subunit GpA-like protein